jgi:hypothetical protein
MAITDVLAALPVPAVDDAIQWYTRLLGRPPDARPMPGLADWHFSGTGSLQLVEDANRAGGGLVTLTIDDVKTYVVGLAERGIDAGSVDDTTSDKVFFVSVEDPYGNSITLVQRR